MCQAATVRCAQAVVSLYSRYRASGCCLVAPNARSPVSRQCPKTGANTVDATTHYGRRRLAELDVLDTIEHSFTLSGSLGVKWSPVQILSARPQVNSDRIAVRSTKRVGFGQPHPASVVRISLSDSS
jgi:hypothetical protein